MSVTTLPTVFGEKTVMRLTSKDGLTSPRAFHLMRSRGYSTIS
ncbi:MAG: hypothetical protein ACLTDF_06325 [Coprococcus sp.]